MSPPQSRRRPGGSPGGSRSAGSTQPRTRAAAHDASGAARRPARRPEPRSRFDLGLEWDWFRPPPHALSSAGWVLLPLRAFLGITFVFAGLQKLANPAFFDAANPASIQAQLAGAQRVSPIHSLIGPLTHFAVPLGLFIAFAELAIGLGTILGLWARAAAAGGILLSLMLFLTVSYHSHPYYTGSDIVFLFAWTPLVLAGAGGVLSADAVFAHRVRRRMGAEPAATVTIPFALARRACGAYEDGRCQARHGEPCAPAPCPYLLQQPSLPRRIDQEEIDRRTFVATGAAAGAVSVGALVLGGLVAGIGRLTGSSPAGGTPSIGQGAAATSTTQPPVSATSSPPAASAAPTTTTTSAPSRPAGTKIGPAHDVPVGGAAAFQDPSSGDPSLVIQPQTGRFLAFDAVCPHAGCTVEYDAHASLFVCPCHGSEFNGRTGAVEVGPAARGLTRLSIAEGSDGSLYVS